jgi:transcriptional regulator with XRE-family HTH domain
VFDIYHDVFYISAMLTPPQLRAARALLGIDQATLAKLAGVSLPTIQRMEGSEGYVRGVVGSLMKVVDALQHAGIELIGENAASSSGGRGVRLRMPAAASLPVSQHKTESSSRRRRVSPQR